jgi:hypothetical protein
MAVVPHPLRRVVDDWRAAGSPSQEGIAWPRQRWTDRFPSHAPLLAALPDRLSRPAVRRACLGAGRSPARAEEAFLTVMAWGYGRVGYGPFRARRVLDTTPGAGALFQAAASKLAHGSLVQAYELLGDRGLPRVARLGPAFGTKYLYFCSPTGRPPALILDRLVALWLRRNTDLAVNEARWSVRTYGRYLATMFSWAEDLDLAPDELEACVFSEQAGLLRNQWTPGSQGTQQQDLRNPCHDWCT